MNQRNLQLWLDALRSGEYEQGKGYLNKDGKLCCLGVLCEVAIADGVDLVKEPESDLPTVIGYSGCVTSPPGNVRTWLTGEEGWQDIPRPMVDLNGDMERTNVVRLNDSMGWTFERIADALEANYSKVKA